MPIAKTAFIRTTATLMIIGMLALVAIVGVTVWLVQRSDAHFEDVIAARDARAAVVELRRSIQEMEGGQRGYLLTGDDTYLRFYRISRDAVEGQYRAVRRAIARLDVDTGAIETMGDTIRTKIAEMERTIELYEGGRQEEALDIVRTDRGRELMDEARTMFGELIALADSRLVDGIENQRTSADALWWTSILGGLVIIAVGGGAVWVALSYTRDLLQARSELEVLNTDLEARVDERTQDLIRANEEVQRFAYIVTHDLRAPLVNVMGFTSELDATMKTIQAYVLADGQPLGEEQIREARLAASEDMPEAIGFIRSSTQKMDSLINAILKISREGRRELKPEQIDIEELLEETSATVRHQVAETEGAITVDAAGLEIVSDRLSLGQIFGNLVDNAVKYGAADRPVEISITGSRQPGNRIAISFSDNGRGIAPEDHSRVFDLFRRSGTQDRPGEGIGLAHVRTLVRNLGGDITLTSEFGKGSTFVVTLPLDLRNFLRRQRQ